MEYSNGVGSYVYFLFCYNVKRRSETENDSRGLSYTNKNIQIELESINMRKNTLQTRIIKQAHDFFSSQMYKSELVHNSDAVSIYSPHCVTVYIPKVVIKAFL